MNVDYYYVLLPLAMILLLSKFLTAGCRRIGLPQVVGMLIAGLLISLIKFIPSQNILNASSLEGLGFLAKIGVILIMFSAGLETDVKQIKAVGVPAIVITAFGVIVPLGLGFVVATLFNGGFSELGENVYSNLFYGVILTATSVSVTVSTLKEMGKLSGKVGSTVVSAAILDDVIGIIVLSLVLSLSQSGSGENAVIVLVKTILFFIAAFTIGTLLKKAFDALDKRYPHHRRIPIWGLAMCFFFAYSAEKFFGVADITGAFVAGLMLAKNKDAEYIDRKSDILSYMIFTPVFFANIGINTSFSGIDASFVWFGLAYVATALVSKVIGCGGSALALRYSVKDSLRVGIGMMARAEVMLVCAQKGVENGLVHQEIMPFIVLIIILSSFLTPIILKLSYKKEELPSPSIVA